MAINWKILFKQMRSIYRMQGSIGIIIYVLKACNYIIINKYFRGSFSQMGEDLYIYKLFHKRNSGFYIDIGACDPRRLNNTKFFYDRGWHGINIEPNSTRIKNFLQARKRDINLNIGIGSIARKALFYEFESASLSTFSQKEARSLLKAEYKLRRTMYIQIYKLSDIMKKYVTGNIDFMTVDTEGMELDILRSNDWSKYRPKLLCIETIDPSDMLGTNERNSVRKARITRYLQHKGYQEHYDNGLNTFYREAGF